MKKARERLEKLRGMLKIVNTLPGGRALRHLDEIRRARRARLRREQKAAEDLASEEERTRAERIAEGLEAASELLKNAVERGELRHAEELLDKMKMLSEFLKEEPEQIRNPLVLRELREASEHLSMLPEMIPQELVEEEARRAGVPEKVSVKRDLLEHGGPRQWTTIPWPLPSHTLSPRRA